MLISAIGSYCVMMISNPVDPPVDCPLGHAIQRHLEANANTEYGERQHANVKTRDECVNERREVEGVSDKKYPNLTTGRVCESDDEEWHIATETVPEDMTYEPSRFKLSTPIILKIWRTFKRIWRDGFPLRLTVALYQLLGLFL